MVGFFFPFRWCVSGFHLCGGLGRSVRMVSDCFFHTSLCIGWTSLLKSWNSPAGTFLSLATVGSPSLASANSGPLISPTWWPVSYWNLSEHFGETLVTQKIRRSNGWKQTCRSLERGSLSWPRSGRSCTSCWLSRRKQKQQILTALLSSHHKNNSWLFFHYSSFCM